MKKAYGKPQIVFENYSFTSNIAQSCGWGLELHSESTCMSYTTASNPYSGCVFIENGYSFFAGVICDKNADEDGSLCYHVIADEIRAFSS